MLNQIKKENKKKQNGFSLIESLIAIALLMISVTAPMLAAWSGLKAAYVAEDQIVAYYLTQDAMEYMRNKVYYQKLAKKDILDDGPDIFNACIADNEGDKKFYSNKNGCNIDTFKSPNDISQISNYSPDNSDKLYYHSDSGKYDYESGNGTKTRFSREVKIGYIDNDKKEVRIEVIVHWTDNTENKKTYKSITHLTKW